jgi:excisionase family DNA binding protein
MFNLSKKAVAALRAAMTEVAPALLSVDAARKRLSCGRTRIYQLMNDGKLRYVEVGSRRYISEAAIASFIATAELATHARHRGTGS